MNPQLLQAIGKIFPEATPQQIQLALATIMKQAPEVADNPQMLIKICQQIRQSLDKGTFWKQGVQQAIKTKSSSKESQEAINRLVGDMSYDAMQSGMLPYEKEIETGYNANKGKPPVIDIMKGAASKRR